MNPPLQPRSRWLLLLLPLLFFGCQNSWRAIKYNIPGQTDYKKFASVPVRTGSETFPLVVDTARGIGPLDNWAMGPDYKPGMRAEDFMRATKTYAMVVLRNDTIVYEKYVEGYNRFSTLTTFSLAKAYVATMVGIAIHEGYIESVNQPVHEYIPHFKSDTTLQKITIRHLLQMTSGIKTNESYISPWGSMAQIYYGTDLDEIVNQVKPEREPGEVYKYQNINTQILGIILEKATGKPISKYLEEKIWIPLGMESEATWSTDREGGREKAFCCINARARDFARFGLLHLHNGNHNGQQIIPEDWICKETCWDTLGGARAGYQFHWFTTPEQMDYWGEGLFGQFTYVSPSTNTVIVRFGNGIPFNDPWRDMFRVISGLTLKPRPIEMSKSELKQFAGTYVFGTSNTGDTTLVGTRAKFKVKAKKGGLRVRYDEGKPFMIFPMSSTRFFSDKRRFTAIRRLTFHPEEDGTVNRLRWYRDGNEWELRRLGTLPPHTKGNPGKRENPRE